MISLLNFIAKAFSSRAPLASSRSYCSLLNLCIFKVDKFSVNFDNEIKSKQEAKLFELSHEYTDDEGYDNWIIFDVFSSYDEAKKSELEETKKSPYNKNPEGFCISECKIDVCGWSEGFVLWC